MFSLADRFSGFAKKVSAELAGATGRHDAGKAYAPSESKSPANTNDMNDNEKLLTAEEMSKRLKCNAEWVLQQVRASRIPCIKFNQRVYRFHWPTVLEAIQRL